MTRVVLLILAAALGLAAAVLVATGFTITVDGQQVSCQGPIVVHEGSDGVDGPAPAHPARSRRTSVSPATG